MNTLLKHSNWFPEADTQSSKTKYLCMEKAEQFCFCKIENFQLRKLYSVDTGFLDLNFWETKD